jgi:cyclophilin family peptidyl-prolyl cis-trans isomerase
MLSSLQIFSRIVLTGLLLTLACNSAAIASQRIALVIGNSAYPAGRLKNPVNDAADIAQSLSNKGFEVTKILNADKRQLKGAINQFTQKINTRNTVGLFYFAGHGMEIDGQNYLIPVDADIQSGADVEYEAVNAGRLLSGMREAGNGLNLVILDACRNNPYLRSSRSATRGLTRMSPPSGALVLYATEPGRVAEDGEGRNGTFTRYLLEAMEQPGITVEQAFKRTAINVRNATDARQTPWVEGVILGDFYFKPPASPAESQVALIDLNKTSATATATQQQLQESAGEDLEALQDKLKSPGNPVVTLSTNKGNIVLELFADEAPKSVRNFLQYVDSGFYADTIFHRVIPNFMIQGGGFTENMRKKPGGLDAIGNEADNGLKNKRGTLAMARTSDPHSATSQFFINTRDNDNLNFKSKDKRKWGYTVFGRVIEGMDVVEAIEGSSTTTKSNYRDVPRQPVIIESVYQFQ